MTEANYKAQIMNSFLNVKTAEKFLQFGPSKCKAIFVGRKDHYDLSGDLTVDKWTTKYVNNNKFPEKYKLLETYEGKVKIEKVNQHKYLGFIISNSSNNLPNIRELKRKSIGTI